MKNFFKKLLLLSLFISTSVSIGSVMLHAESQSSSISSDDLMKSLFKAETFTSSDGTTLNYRIFLPQNYDQSKQYPLILFLHGAGQRGNDNFSQIKIGINEPFKDTSSEIYNCIVIAPQCPTNAQWVNVRDWTYCNYSTDKIAESKHLAATVEPGKIQSTYKADKDRTYVTGLSMGGYGTWDLIVRHPDIFAAAMPLCGGANTSKAEIIKDIPIWTFHGKKDGVVPYHGTELMVNNLKAIQGKITYTPIADGEHAIWPTVYARDDIFPWLLSHKLSDRLGELTTEPTETPTTEIPTTPEPDQTVTETPTTEIPTTPEQESGGCKSTASATAALLTTLTVAATTCKKRKKDN